jgi:hypothetical protein
LPESAVNQRFKETPKAPKFTEITLGKYTFQYLRELPPQKDDAGNYIVERPQDDAEQRKTKKFHKYGNQDFCALDTGETFPEGSIVYVLYDAENVLYIGETENMKERFGPRGYKQIFPAKCFIGGQLTNCKVNANILRHYRFNKNVYLYYLQAKDRQERKRIENQLIHTSIQNERPIWTWNKDGTTDAPNDPIERQITTIKIKIDRPLDNTPSETFDYGQAKKYQKQAIYSTDGPVLITAGPGTGKTFTLVQRALYLIQEKGVKPEEILMATFTEKAAKELITRISNELLKKNILVNLN